MRTAVFVAILVASSALLAGCSSKKTDDHTFVCTNGTTLDLTKFPGYQNSTFSAASHCSSSGSGSRSGSNSRSNTTALAPNKLPILKLMIMDDGGNMTNVTMLKGNLTFDATGSSDPDGQVTGIAVTVQDSNQTRTATLYDPVKKAFKPAHFKFDRPGVVNVTVAMVDDRAGFTVNQTHIYVDHFQVLNNQAILLPLGAQLATDSCAGGFETQGNLGALWFKDFSFELVNGATFVEATQTTSAPIVPGDPSLTICSPDGMPLSDAGTSAITNPGVDLKAPTGTAAYYVGVTTSVPAINESVTVSVLVHYEPDTR